MVDVIFKGFMFGFWLTSFSCLVGYIAKKVIYTFVSLFK